MAAAQAGDIPERNIQVHLFSGRAIGVAGRGMGEFRLWVWLIRLARRFCVAVLFVHYRKVSERASSFSVCRLFVSHSRFVGSVGRA